MNSKKKSVNKVVSNTEIGDLDELDSLLAELNTGNQQDECSATLKQVEVNQQAEEVSLQTLKNRLKKQKKKQAKAQGASEESNVGTTSKNKSMSIAARAAAERLRLIQEAEEETKRREEEERRLEEDRKRQEEEAIRKRNEERELKLKLKKERREQLKAEGKLLTAKERHERLKRQQYLHYLQSHGVLLNSSQKVDSSLLKEQETTRTLASRKKKVYRRLPETQEFINETTSVTSIIDGTGLADDELISKHIPETWEEFLQDEGTDSLDVKYTTSYSTNVEYEGNSRLAVDFTTCTNEQVHGDVSERSEFRSPICCILGHVDTGKTKILDKMRKTNIQDNEAGGITQQIGATFFPPEMLSEQIKRVDREFELQIPGLLFIDTPGHESFNNLRSRGSSLCDIAVLVVDIMHGLEPQTKESIGLLRNRKCPFIIALNKIDRLYGWTGCSWLPIRDTLDKQKSYVNDEFGTRLSQTLLQLSEEGLNCCPYWENDDLRSTVSIVPTSAITGEGVPDLIYLIAKLTQKIMGLNFLKLNKTELSCTILEVKAIDGLGVTIDVILVSGTLHEGDTIVVCGLSAPIVTTIRALLTPQPMRELRVKSDYVHHHSITASMGVKICANGLDDAVAGTQLMIVPKNATEEDIELLREQVMEDMGEVFRSVDKSGNGVYVMASTLGSLEALLVYLKSCNIPVVALNIGTVHKLDVRRASIMHERGHPEMAVILAFDIKVEAEAELEAKKLGVKIMKANIIYHLCDMFTKYYTDVQEEKRKEKSLRVVFPCVLKIIPQYIFNVRDPIICGVYVEEGILKPGTPLCIPDKDNLMIGKVASVEFNKKTVNEAKKGQEVAIKIQPLGSDTNIIYGRHFDHNDKLVSRITRESIDILKNHFRDDLSKEDWKLVIQLKRVFGIS
ncbi:eukaryotic translation initiation factor 5B, putative [Cryptosporidium muris RN66]|uniref:Eukaryotic translation initiation factor 5B n=1 Tax=Cryptosporidium muris (strain RN66) TaxID=441375 RepID=B6ADI8_CRYMR|nr:eukaryotic translation initiation factor 5B, putative [Cryptosporidium muris RN66]EEA06279.1 eukaryotic translation initiation factor 5B, putative [Cryptosporidium muris RN66]|eukprot:XP_002140628.1 eukaryotic translation initiation factor 5B [Cryptosporidium muris RN66]